jgi:hypothetical protein
VLLRVPVCLSLAKCIAQRKRPRKKTEGYRYASDQGIGMVRSFVRLARKSLHISLRGESRSSIDDSKRVRDSCEHRKAKTLNRFWRSLTLPLTRWPADRV